VLAAEPEHERGDAHQHAGHAERDLRAEVAQEDRHQQGREERAEVDDPVERVEHELREVLGRLVELVADERGDQRLDAARCERDQREAGVKTRPVLVEHGQHALADAVEQAEPEDGVVLAPETVGEPAAKQREQVHADHEGVEHVLRGAGALGLGQVHQQRGHEERRQDVAHPVEREALGALVADDVGHLRRQARARGVGGHQGSSSLRKA
jgi:hypothetical protein